MISTNPLLRSIVIVLCFWYVGLFALAGYHGVPVWHVIYVFPTSILISCMGLAAGFAAALLVHAGDRGITSSEITSGSRSRGATFSLGAPPTISQPPRARIPRETLASLPWLPAVQDKSPVYAAAIKAVLETMCAIPRLPASPYPGGHGGRSLIDHSIAVASQMLPEASTWVYRGQKSKRGVIRVPLANKDEPHSFQSEDAPLLLLTGLAHDIGKMVCYRVDEEQPASQKPGDLFSVTEIRMMHDTEGARLLRRIPEVMALPMADRTALLTAIAYYHHPFGLPTASWLTDRVRSLTELLAQADIAVGVKEGHALIHQDDDEDDGDVAVVAPVAATSSESQARDAALARGGLEETDEDELAALDSLRMMAAAAELPVKKAGKAPAPATTAPSAPPNKAPMELRLFMEALARPGAVNGKNRGSRIAWKHGEMMYVMENVMRTRVQNQGGADPVWASTALAPNNGNAAPFTISLAKQLDDFGALVTTHDGMQFSPSRSLFKIRTPEGGVVTALIVKTASIPGGHLHEDCLPMEIVAPLWGANSARNKPKPGASVTVGAVEYASPSAAADDDDGDQELPLPLPPEPAAQQEAPEGDDMDDADFPMDLGPKVSALVSPLPPVAPVTPVSVEAPEAVDLPEASEAADMFGAIETPPAAWLSLAESAPTPEVPNSPAEPEVLDAATILLEVITSDDFKRYDYEVREKEGKRYATIPLDSPAGAAVTTVIGALRDQGLSVDRIKIATLGSTGQKAYIVAM